MRVLLINSVCGIRSTGRICVDLAEKFENAGDEVKIAYGRECVPQAYEKYAVKIGRDLDTKIHAAVFSRGLDSHGFGSRKATKKFLEWAEEYNPDLLWLHNLHGHYINIELLFGWIKKRTHMQVKWTLHDCWAFTGHCSHFGYVKCDKWKEHCSNCEQKKMYPSSLLFDCSNRNYEKKKRIFTGVKNLTIITPSQWLAALVKQGYMKEYPVKVCYNTIDTDVFKPCRGNFRKKYNLQGKKVILGVASSWGERKGIFDFLKLAKIIPEDFKIVLVGLSEKQLRKIPKNIIGIKRTNSLKELAEIYTAADVFFNPTYEDTYPTVNLEAEACGTRVITYATDGAPETIKRNDSIVIPVGAYERVLDFI